MNLFSIFNKKKSEPTSVAEALNGVADAGSAKSRSRRAEQRNSDVQNEQLVPEKKRARRRLIGAIAMVLAIVIGLPMVLDSEPKPISKNIVIQIPSKDVPTSFLDSKDETVQNEAPEQPARQGNAPNVNDLPALNATAPASSADSSTVGSTSTKHTNSDVASPSGNSGSSAVSPNTSTKTTIKSDAKAELKHDTDTAVNKDSATKPKTMAKTPDVHTNDDAARAKAILEGTDTTAGSSGAIASHIVIQVGAFATQEKVNELQDKLTSAGIKSFTQKVATSSGDKIRVRVGPFSDKESADKVKHQLEKLGLNASLISL